MNEYVIQQKLATLTYNSVITSSQNYFDFVLDGLSFAHWDFSHQQGWTGEAWLIECKVQGPSANEVAKVFHEKMLNICPKIAFVGQAYTTFSSEPFIIIKNNKEIYLDMKSFEKPVSLAFMKNELKALKILTEKDVNLDGKKIPEEFYFYWNEAVNTVGYTSKLFLLTSALECLVKQHGKVKKYTLLENILGLELKDILWKPVVGLRHRLVHGEYITKEDTKVDYAEQIHKKVTIYFNKNIFSEKLIREEVVRPHRNYKYAIQQERLPLEVATGFKPKDFMLRYIIDNYENIKSGSDVNIKISDKVFDGKTF